MIQPLQYFMLEVSDRGIAQLRIFPDGRREVISAVHLPEELAIGRVFLTLGQDSNDKMWRVVDPITRMRYWISDAAGTAFDIPADARVQAVLLKKEYAFDHDCSYVLISANEIRVDRSHGTNVVHLTWEQINALRNSMQ